MDMHRRVGSRRDTDGCLCHRRQSEQRACAAGSHHTCHDNRTGGNGSIRCDVCITAVISRTADHAGDNTDDNTGGNTAEQAATTAPKPTDAYRTESVPEGKPQPQEPQEQTITPEKHTCTFSVSCASVLAQKDTLSASVKEVVPDDGVILPPLSLFFNEGESVFDVLARVCREQHIHMEYTNTPIYNSAYIEGIGNLYEFDCGAGSGWMYRVNGWFPNYGSSRYAVKDGDVIEWLYTCDLGRDIGGNYGAQTGE